MFIETFVPHGVSQVVFEAYDLSDPVANGGFREPYETTNVSKARMMVLRKQSVRDQFLQVTTTTRHATVGEYLIIHVKASYFVSKLNWIVTGKGLVILSGQETVRAMSYTFSVAVTAEMAPKAHIVVFDVAAQGDVVADRLTIPVDGISRNKFTFAVNHHKDYYKRTFEVHNLVELLRIHGMHE